VGGEWVGREVGHAVDGSEELAEDYNKDFRTKTGSTWA
jgi:hypothetical protein